MKRRQFKTDLGPIMFNLTDSFDGEFSKINIKNDDVIRFRCFLADNPKNSQANRFPIVYENATEHNPFNVEPPDRNFFERVIKSVCGVHEKYREKIGYLINFEIESDETGRISGVMISLRSEIVFALYVTDEKIKKKLSEFHDYFLMRLSLSLNREVKVFTFNCKSDMEIFARKFYDCE